MYYIQFYQKSAISEDIIEACGDRSVIVVDGRESRETIRLFAEKEGVKRGYLAWALFKGESFSRSAKVSGRWTIYNKPADLSAMTATHGV